MPTCSPTAAAGLDEVSEDAVLAANYLRHRLADTYDMPFAQVSKHEFVASAARLKAQTGVRMLDIAKRIIDKGFHPPTIYFPLTVEECMLVEPTETESVETLDAFADALIEIAARPCETRNWSRPRRMTRRPPPRRGDRRAPAGPALAADDGRSSRCARNRFVRSARAVGPRSTLRTRNLLTGRFRAHL